MLEAYRATPHPSTSRSPYELMFGRKMNLNIFPTMKRRAKDEGIRNHDRKYKEKAKKYHDSKKNVKKSRIRLGDRVLMKDRRIDRLRPEIGLVIGTTEHSVTVKFENGKIFTRDKSHVKVINEVTVPSSQRRLKKRIQMQIENRNDMRHMTQMRVKKKNWKTKLPLEQNLAERSENQNDMDNGQYS